MKLWLFLAFKKRCNPDPYTGAQECLHTHFSIFHVDLLFNEDLLAGNQKLCISEVQETMWKKIFWSVDFKIQLFALHKNLKLFFYIFLLKMNAAHTGAGQ